MHEQEAKKVGNRHSTLLDQLIEAAEKAKPKSTPTFADSIIRIASTPTPKLTDSLKKLAAEISKSNKVLKHGQITRSVEPGGLGEGEGLSPEESEFAEEPDVDFDAMAGGAEEPGVPDPGAIGPAEDALPEETGGDVEAAKRSLADALVALCGSPEEAKACLDQSAGEGGLEGMPEPLPEDGELGPEGGPEELGALDEEGPLPPEEDVESPIPAETEPAEMPAPAPMPMMAKSKKSTK